LSQIILINNQLINKFIGDFYTNKISIFTPIKYSICFMLFFVVEVVKPQIEFRLSMTVTSVEGDHRAKG